jgi:hypothetical protein
MSLWRKRNVKHNEQKHDNLSNPLYRLNEENVRLGLYEDAYDLSIKSDDLSIKSSKGIEMSIEAMKQTLAKVRAAQQCHPNAVMALLCEADEMLEKAIAEAEQEQGVPIAEVTSETGAEITMSWWHEPALPIGTKLYTTPQQRTWVGLTDEEQQQAYEQWQNDGWGVFYNAIEAKLKEKNT